MVGQLNWVSQHTSPDTAFEVSDLSRGFKQGTTRDMKRVKKVVKVKEEN